MTKAVGIGIVGFGTVGRATAEILSQHASLIGQRNGVDLALAAVCRRSGFQPGEIPAGALAFSDWREVVRDPNVDVVVETMGGTGESLQLVKAALEAGKPVVTANKNLLAAHGDELFGLAASKNLPIGFEASVAAAIPIVRVIYESIASDQLSAVRGILNGTANYVLTKMESCGIGFDAALQQARDSGYAEADPASDIDGIDTRDKLCILARMAFGRRIETSKIPTYGIRQIREIDIQFAQRLDRTIRLLGSAETTARGLEISVRPWMVSRRSMLGNAEGVNNAIFLLGEKIGSQVFYGPGAGGNATGAAVVSDVIEIARDLTEGRLRAKKISGFLGAPVAEVSTDTSPASWYLRITMSRSATPAVEKIATQVTQILQNNGISVELMERQQSAAGETSFLVTVAPVSEALIRNAVRAIGAVGFVAEPPLILQIQ